MTNKQCVPFGFQYQYCLTIFLAYMEMSIALSLLYLQIVGQKSCFPRLFGQGKNLGPGIGLFGDLQGREVKLV